MSSSSSTETKKKKLEKLEEISEGRNRKEAGSKNKEESAKNIKKKEVEGLKGRRKKKSLSTSNICLIFSSIAYLDGETMKENCALPGTARAARPTSPSSLTSSRTSSPSTAAQESLPPSETRSLSPNSMFTNGSTLCAQYRQRTADSSKREDDRVSCSTNVCGPITANRLSQQRKSVGNIGISGDPTENVQNSS
jgi:chromatin remodeling complex protein RSC6